MRHMPPQPRTSFEGPALSFEFPGLSIGIAEYDEGPTGCTVFHFEPGVRFAADVRGGSVGQVHADVGLASAICFAGGSLLGLEAAAGVASALFDRRGHDHADWTDVPVVPGAIIFDFGGRANGVYPDAALGRAAIDAAKPGLFPLGRRGAARSATVGKAIDFAMAEPGGQGAALRSDGPASVLVVTVLNSLGAIYDRDGAIIRGNRRPNGTRIPALGVAGPPGNTTLTLALTNLKVDSRQLAQAARQAHAAMARAIQPFHTELDGDIFFFATTASVEHPPLLAPGALGALAGETAWDAVLAAFP
jgi:L-aminopeptidase/D-esterase-like protein